MPMEKLRRRNSPRPDLRKTAAHHRLDTISGQGSVNAEGRRGVIKLALLLISRRSTSRSEVRWFSILNTISRSNNNSPCKSLPVRFPPPPQLITVNCLPVLFGWATFKKNRPHPIIRYPLSLFSSVLLIPIQSIL